MFSRGLSLLTLFFLFVAASPLFSTEKTVWMGIVVLNNDATIRDFFSKIDSLKYNKSAIFVHLDVLNDSPETIEFIRSWCHINELNYEGISCNIQKTTEPIQDKIASLNNQYLQECQNSDYLLIMTSHVFLNPCTLKLLVGKQLPVVSPLMRPLPKAGDPFTNFYSNSTPDGYYKYSAKDGAITFRHSIGTFQVACTQKAYLIDTHYAEKLNFKDEFRGWDFVSLARTGKRNGVSIHLCNEREFGFFIHLPDEASLEDERSLVLPSIRKRLTPADFKRIITAYIAHDQTLKSYIDSSFTLSNHSIYKVEDDFYCVDENYDFIKHCFIKKGLRWEPHIGELLKQYAVPGSTAIDLGGHIGTHTISLSQFVGEEGQVHVFEPQIKMFTELLLNLELNECSNVISHREAIGNQMTTIEMTHPREGNEGMGKIGQGGETAPMKTLDSYNLENVSVIKIDIEGYEMEALKGAKETLRRNRPVMIVEVLATPEREWRLKQIQAMGYEVRHISQDDYLCLPK